MQSFDYIRRFSELGIDDVPLVGGKNASLGEMYQALTGKGVRVPNGFATTAQAFRDYLEHNGLTARIGDALETLDVDDVDALAATGAQIRGRIVDAELPQQLADEIVAAYREMEAEYGSEPDVAVRSSATAEDLPGGVENLLAGTGNHASTDASFGEQEGFIWNAVLEAGGTVQCVCVPGGGSLTRKDTDALAEWSKGFGAKGMAAFNKEQIRDMNALPGKPWPRALGGRVAFRLRRQRLHTIRGTDEQALREEDERVDRLGSQRGVEPGRPGRASSEDLGVLPLCP